MESEQAVRINGRRELVRRELDLGYAGGLELELRAGSVAAENRAEQVGGGEA
ncbi:hypothetical protein IMZ48_49390 [Candidatus Bathyarchaeota archaeon]|nr:hypothetical protein [Candidatus Bathyarchaeota archaeon]